MGYVELRNLTKTFSDGEVVAVDDVTLEIDKGEFFSLLGPSGCGKTTTLRIIAGFEKPDRGEVWINGVNVDNQPPEKRRIGMVFQNLALFPHKDVFDNIAFGLRMRKIPKKEIKKRVSEALDLAGLPGYQKRKINQLSGGEKQRVALARSIIFEPSLFLLDEPLASLDKNLREHMKLELRKLQKKLGVTTLYVTHDQSVALATSDRIAVMNHGKIIEVGAAEEMYNTPRTMFTASFIGETNFLEGSIEKRINDMAIANFGQTSIKIYPKEDLRTGDDVKIAIRPEKIQIMKFNASKRNVELNFLSGNLENKVFVGDFTLYEVMLKDGKMIKVKEQNVGRKEEISVGEKVLIAWKFEDSIGFK